MDMERYFETNFEKYDLSYYLIKSRTSNMYGVGVKSKTDAMVKSSFCYNISDNREEIIDFLELLCRTATFPTTLNDMVEDWLFEKTIS